MCTCRLEIVREQRMSRIPGRFADVVLEELKPNGTETQIVAIPWIKQNPESSVIMTGRVGTGKSHLLWAMYRAAVDRNAPRIAVFTLTQLLTEYKNVISAQREGSEARQPRLQAADLQQRQVRFSIFIDDIDKAKPTEYAAEHLFEIVNSIYEFGHQLVVTTNLNLARLADHFDRADERFGRAIVRRIADGAKIFDFK